MREIYFASLRNCKAAFTLFFAGCRTAWRMSQRGVSEEDVRFRVLRRPIAA